MDGSHSKDIVRLFYTLKKQRIYGKIETYISYKKTIMSLDDLRVEDRLQRTFARADIGACLTGKNIRGVTDDQRDRVIGAITSCQKENLTLKELGTVILRVDGKLMSVMKNIFDIVRDHVKYELPSDRN